MDANQENRSSLDAALEAVDNGEPCFVCRAQFPSSVADVFEAEGWSLAVCRACQAAIISAQLGDALRSATNLMAAAHDLRTAAGRPKH